MKSYLVFVAFLAWASALPLDIFEDDDGQQFYLVPMQRQKRDTTWDVAKGPGGTNVQLGQEGTIWAKGNHEIIGGGHASKNFNPNGPLVGGGSIGYHHIPTDTNIKASATHIPNWGTQADIKASRTLWAPDRNTKLEAFGGASQSFTKWGNTRPEANVGLQFTHGHNMFGG
ncbi:unnamed protein product [Brassicogethes aeneus]|uniref:Attacin C-terminal domain-containing protein n=1 Tax=Brassicogethes aeneus TaxID=1431903 RepID=A0A9P0FAD3_BRAAE|nr:unnamed protein product [Brassicogethes aeneus]